MLGFVIIGVGVGLVFLVVGLYQRGKVKESLSWRQVTGSIVSSSVQRSRDDDGDTFTPCVSYKYEVGTNWYKGDRIGFTRDSHNQASTAEAALAPYQLNAQVTVYFNPQKPSDSVLVRKASGWMLWIGIAVLVLVLGVAIRFAK